LEGRRGRKAGTEVSSPKRLQGLHCDIKMQSWQH
jgi:hypothetical protein